MALSESVTASLLEAKNSIRNALAYAARQERATVCNSIARLLAEIERIESFDNLMDKLDEIHSK